MKTLFSVACTVLVLAIAVGILAFSGYGGVVQASLHTHLLDWGMGAVCLLWLMVILKVPWDLYFQALDVHFELERARERKIATDEGASSPGSEPAGCPSRGDHTTRGGDPRSAATHPGHRTRIRERRRTPHG